jgi:hypothetical protein
MWVARNYNGKLWLYTHKPQYMSTSGCYLFTDSDFSDICELDPKLFPNVKNCECIEVILKPLVEESNILESLSNNKVQDILEEMGILDKNGNCPYTVEEIFKAGIE